MATIFLFKSSTPDPVIVGQPLTYTLTIFNIGPDEAENIELTDLLPATVNLISTTGLCVTGVNPNLLFCNVGDIPAGTSESFTITVEPIAPGTITNLASAVGDNTNFTQVVETTQVVRATTLSVTKVDVPDPAFVGETLTYTIEITNTGLENAVNVLFTDPLPTSVEFISANAPCSLSPNNQLTCQLGTIAAGATVTVVIQVRPTLPGLLVNTAFAQGPNTNLASGTAETQVLRAVDLAVTKTANDRAQVGQGLTYTVTVRNSGPIPATDVVLIDELPDGVRFISATSADGGCTLTGQRLTCQLGTLDPGETVVVTILVVPTRPGILTNTALVFSDEVDRNPANNQASATTVVSQCLPLC